MLHADLDGWVKGIAARLTTESALLPKCSYQPFIHESSILCIIGKGLTKERSVGHGNRSKRRMAKDRWLMAIAFLLSGVEEGCNFRYLTKYLFKL